MLRYFDLRCMPVDVGTGTHMHRLISAAGMVLFAAGTSGGKTPVTVSGAIYLPKGQAPNGGWPIVAWAHGLIGVADICAPSWIPRSARDTEYLNAWLALGFAIVATGVPFHAPFSPAPKAKQVDVPERKGGGLNASSAILRLYDFKTLNAAFDPFQYLTDEAKPVFEQAGTSCNADLIKSADERHLTTDNIFKKNPTDANAMEARYVRYPTPRFARPIFIGTGLADVTAIPEGQYNVAIAACSEGSTVEMHYYPGKDHGGTVLASLADSVPFVKKLLAGQRIDGNCSGINPPSSAK